MGFVYSWGGLVMYYISYMRETDPTITVNDGFFVMPIMIFTNAITVYAGAASEAKYGPRM
jgi:hypothetical protein